MASLKFKTLKIHRAPGFRHGLHVPGLNDLAGDINIIAGPNAAGKTTIARLIHQIIWPDKSALTDIESSFTINDDLWSVHIDPVVQIIQKNGIDAQATGIPPKELQKIYMLALHELVGQDDEDLATRILNESSGGYDMDNAASVLGYSGEIKRKSAVSDNLNKAIRELERIKNTHEDLKSDEEGLFQLENRKKEAEKAVALRNLYEKAVEFYKAKEEALKTKTLLENFPEVLKEATGDELKRIQEMDEDLENENLVIEEAGKLISNEEAVIKELQLPEKGIGDELLDKFNESISLMSELEKSEKEIEIEIKELEAGERSARENISNIKDIDQWKGIKPEEAGELDSFFRNALILIHRELTISSEIKWLENEEQKASGSPELLNKGITILGEWLKENKISYSIPLWSIIALSFAALLTSLAVYFWGKYGFFAFTLIIGVLIIILISKSGRSKNSKQKFREEDFKKTGLTEPLIWESEAVSKRLDELITELTDIHQIDSVNKEKQGRLKELKNRHENLNIQIKEMHKTREKLLEKLKVMPDFPESTEESISSLYLFLEGLKKWQSAYSELIVKKERQNSINDLKNTELNKCNAFFNSLNIDPVNEPVEARAVFKRLFQAENKRRDAVRNINNQKNRIEDSIIRIKNTAERINAIYKQLQVEPGNINDLRRIMELYPDFKNAFTTNNNAFINLNIRKNELKSHPFYNNYEGELNNSNLFEVQAKAEEYTLKAKKLEELNESITRIRTLIEQKKEGAELENALAEKKNAESELEKLYNSNLASLTGFMLAEYLKKETANQNRPEVLRRADEIFSQITKGRYNLIVTDDKGAIFRAIDNKLNKGFALNELSTGTRIQLLIATRLAFVESIEDGIQLPVLADELLANSDDIRANAIIKALTEISSRGRQIFYFTAQADEVSKWIAFLNSRKDISYKIIILGGPGTEENQYTIDDPSLLKISFIQDIPKPRKQNIHEYRKDLKIRDFDLIADNSSQLSVSFLTDDVDLFYSLLISGLDTWGQVIGYYEAGGKIDGLNDQLLRDMKKKIILLDYFQQLYRQGRQRPVSIDEIRNSGIITERFIPAVKEKLDEVKGSPSELINTLMDIPRFRKDTRDQLKEYLIESEYIDNRPQLSEDILKLKLQIKSNDLEISPEEAVQFINNIIGK